MLHTESRQGGAKGVNPLIFVCALVLALMMCGCREKAPNPNKDIGMAAFSDWKTEGYAINSRKIRDVINKLCRADRDSLVADQYTRKYYLNSNAFVWIDRSGVDSRADTLLAALRSVGDMGFGERAFCVAAIERAVGRVRGLDFEDGSPSINETLAYVEYNLTKAYLRYAVGQRFGFTNPSRLFNRLDELPRDSTERFKGFRRLFDVDVERPDQRFYAAAFEAVHADTIGPFLRGVEPRGAMYGRLVFMLPLTRSQQARRRLLCNIERCRWRERGGVRAEDQRRVVVNIPAFHLYAYGPDTVVDMRVGCGSTATKTPLLNSAIERMDVNPVWNIPMSIIKKDIAHHAGDAHYFDSRRYYVVDKNTGERLPVETVTRAMLMGGGCRVVQEGGEGNALGHIIFRFPNNFSVFLHDTSSRGVFGRDYRGVSHGCVRIERPFDFAAFLLDTSDDWLLDKLRMAMGMEPLTERGRNYMASGRDNSRLVSSLKVSPSVPISITYFTLYPDASGQLTAWPDVYGYDEVMWRWIKPLTR